MINLFNTKIKVKKVLNAELAEKKLDADIPGLKNAEDKTHIKTDKGKKNSHAKTPR